MTQQQSSSRDFDRFERETVQRAAVGFPLPDESKVEIPLTRVFGRLSRTESGDSRRRPWRRTGGAACAG